MVRRGLAPAGLFQLRRPGNNVLAELLASQSEASLTYSGVGATLGERTPVGYRRLGAEALLGDGSEVFAAAAEGLREWQAHRGAGLLVYPEDVVVEEGETVVLAIPQGPITVMACCRIVAVIDEPGRFGFAYGTLPVHPEQGEESFIVERRPDGTVLFRVTAFSRHRHPLLRAVGPLARGAQQRGVRRYLRGLQAAVGSRG